MPRRGFESGEKGCVKKREEGGEEEKSRIETKIDSLLAAAKIITIKNTLLSTVSGLITLENCNEANVSIV